MTMIYLRMALIAACFLPLAGAAQAPTPGANREPVRILQFRLELNRVAPSEITVPEGLYLVRLNNGLVLSPVSVLLDQENSARLVDGRILQGRSKFSALVNLRPGIHTLSVPGRNQWRSRITVTRR